MRNARFSNAFSSGNPFPNEMCIRDRFYENFGFERDGEAMEEAGIPHIPMRVTKESLVLKSGCGKELRYKDLFPQK